MNKSVKLIVGAIGTLVAVAYCGGLLYYFMGVAGSIEDAQTIGLGPTMLGLAIFGLLFCVAFLVKFVRLFAATRSTAHSTAAASSDEDAGAFDADAMIARHMARRPAEATEAAAPTRSARPSAAPEQRGFGRRVK